MEVLLTILQHLFVWKDDNDDNDKTTKIVQ